MWSLLRDRRLAGHKFRRQVPVGPYIADFACYDANLLIELDGSQHAENARDQVRDAELRRRGFRILRFWNSDLTDQPMAVLEAVWHAVQEGRSVRGASPSFGASHQLLPLRETGNAADIGPLASPSSALRAPSPLEGEGGRNMGIAVGERGAGGAIVAGDVARGLDDHGGLM